MQFSIIDLIGFAASGLVFLTFCMRTLLPLRMVAIASNVVFIVYGLVAGLLPIFVLHVLLLPMNLWRTAQQIQARQRMRNVLVETSNLDTPLPYMTRADFADRAVIFREGAIADRFYVLTEGEVAIEDFDKRLTPGAIFGEIAFFLTDGKRTATARAVGAVKVTWIDRETVLRVCHDNPDVALFLTRLMVTRLVEHEKVLRDLR